MNNSFANAALACVLVVAGCEGVAETAAPQVSLKAAAVIGAAAWRQVSFSPPMPSFGGRWVTYDNLRGKLILLQNDEYGPPGLRTWEHDGARWTVHTEFGVDIPSAASSAASLAYDSRRDRVVYVVGRSCASETWEWDGTSWARFDVIGPPLREDGSESRSAMTYDTARGRIVWVGQTFAGVETWEWDGTSWQKRTASGPPMASLSVLYYDPAAAKTVYFGASGDWEWDGASWRERGPITCIRFTETCSGVTARRPDSARDVKALSP